jgi:hypothetical protein
MRYKGAHAYLSLEARDAYDQFEMEHGVSFSGLVEALAQAMIEGETDLTFLVTLARRIDAQRRRK